MVERLKHPRIANNRTERPNMTMSRSWADGGPVSLVPHPNFDPATMMLVGTVAGVAGTAISAGGTIAGGAANQKAANFQASQLETEAGEARAAGRQELAGAQVEAEEMKRRKELVLSTLQARAAASGFSATDATTLNLAEEVEEHGTLQEKMALFGGTSRRAARFAQARSLDAQGNVVRWGGQVAKKASYIDAASTILGNTSTLALKYGRPAAPRVDPSGGPYGFG
jgi:hypothetical protein